MSDIGFHHFKKEKKNYVYPKDDSENRAIKREVARLRNENFILKNSHLLIEKTQKDIVLMCLKTYYQAYKNKAVEGAGSGIILNRVKKLMEELK